jgi:hypothetical protein
MEYCCTKFLEILPQCFNCMVQPICSTPILISCNSNWLYTMHYLHAENCSWLCIWAADRRIDKILSSIALAESEIQATRHHVQAWGASSRLYIPGAMVDQPWQATKDKYVSTFQNDLPLPAPMPITQISTFSSWVQTTKKWNHWSTKQQQILINQNPYQSRTKSYKVKSCCREEMRWKFKQTAR